MPDSEETYHAAIMRIDRGMLRRLLLLPDDIKIAAVHFDPVRDALMLRVEGNDLPMVQEGQELQILIGTYSERSPQPGDLVPVFEGF